MHIRTIEHLRPIWQVSPEFQFASRFGVIRKNTFILYALNGWEHFDAKCENMIGWPSKCKLISLAHSDIQIVAWLDNPALFVPFKKSRSVSRGAIFVEPSHYLNT